MRRISIRVSQNVRLLLVLFAGVSLIGGCDSPNSVDAVARNSSFTPVFGEAETESSIPANRNLSFLHKDHFGCVRIQPANILANPDLEDIPWSDLETRLAEMVGMENSKLETVNSIWLLLDQSYFESLASGFVSSAPLFVTVLDYKRKVDEESLASASAEFRANRIQIDPSEKGSVLNQEDSLAIELLNPKRIAIGGSQAVEKLKTDSGSPELNDLIASWDDDAGAEAVIVVSPIRPMLLSYFELLSRFGGDAQKFAQLPDVVENIKIKLNLNSEADGKDVLIVGRVKIEDDQLAKDLVKAINSMSSNSGSIGMASMMGGGMGQSEISDKLMFTPLSNDSVSKFAREIGDKELFSVRNPPGEIVLQLGRPDSFKDVILAAVNDGKKQMQIMQRIERLKKIAEAMKDYEEKYQCLPAKTAISAVESAKLDVPAQFSWRVALLPFLGYQDLYQQFDFSQPWDAPANLAIADEMPSEFMSSENETKTAFHLAAGETATYRSERLRPKLSDLKDRKIWTAIVFEGNPDSEETWTRPEGPDFDSSRTTGFGREDEFGVLFINAMFQVRIVKKDSERLGKVLTSEGEEKMTMNDFIRLN